MELRLDITAQGLSLQNARVCVWAAALAYTAPPTIHDEATDTSVLIQDLGNAIVVAFRGTASLRNFLTDAEALKVERSFGDQDYRVHQGFQFALSAVANLVDAEINRLSPNGDRPIFGCGHSLGGALMKLYALRFGRGGAKGFIHSVYTFGEPRSTDKAGSAICAAQFGARHFRFEDDLDCVTRLPGWLIGYRHSGHNVFLPYKGGYWFDPAWWKKAWSDFRAFYRSRDHGLLSITQLLADHHEARYAEKVGQLT